MKRRSMGQTIERMSARALSAFLTTAGVPLVHRELLSSSNLFDVSLIPPECSDWIRDVRTRKDLRGSLLLCGPPGAGLTTTACWLLAEYWKRSLCDHIGIEIDHADGICRFIRVSDFRRSGIERDRTLFASARAARLLVVDDVGSEVDTHGYTASDLEELIDRRWAEGLATIVTTNLLPDGDPSFRSRYPRAYSMLADARGPGVVSIIRDDLRLKRLDRQR